MALCAKINLPSTGCHRRCNDKISCSVHQQIVFALVCNWLGRENTLGIQLERKLIWHDFTTHNAHLPFLVHWPARHPLCHPPFFFQAAFCCLSFGRCERRKGTSDSRNAFCCLAHFQQAARSHTQDRRPPSYPFLCLQQKTKLFSEKRGDAARTFSSIQTLYIVSSGSYASNVV